MVYLEITQKLQRSNTKKMNHMAQKIPLLNLFIQPWLSLCVPAAWCKYTKQVYCFNPFFPQFEIYRNCVASDKQNRHISLQFAKKKEEEKTRKM